MSTEIIIALVSFFGGLLATGGVGYLVIEHLLNKNRKKEELKQQKVATNKDILGNGVSMLDLYKEMDVIVESKTKPLEEKIDQLNAKLDKYGCFNSSCAVRVRYKGNNEKAEA